MRSLVILITALAAMAGMLAITYLATYAFLRWRFASRVLKLGAGMPLRPRRGGILQFSTRLDRTAWGKRTAERLRLADLDISPTIFLVGQILLFIVLFIALKVLLGLTTVVNLVASGVGAWLVSNSYLRSRKDHYISAFDAQMPEVALLMGNSLRAGLSVPQAIEVVAERMERPAGPEFARLAYEIRLGMGLEEAMLKMLERLPSEELRMMITTIIIQRVAGGNLAHALSVMSEAITARFKLKDEVRTMTAEARYSGLLLVVLPIVVLGLLNWLMEGAVGRFLSIPIGWVIGGLFVGVMASAFMLIGRVSTVRI